MNKIIIFLMFAFVMFALIETIEAKPTPDTNNDNIQNHINKVVVS